MHKYRWRTCLCINIDDTHTFSTVWNCSRKNTLRHCIGGKLFASSGKLASETRDRPATWDFNWVKPQSSGIKTFTWTLYRTYDKGEYFWNQKRQKPLIVTLRQSIDIMHNDVESGKSRCAQGVWSLQSSPKNTGKPKKKTIQNIATVKSECVAVLCPLWI